MIHVSRRHAYTKSLKLIEIRRIANLTFARVGVSGDATIVFTNNAEIQNLNRDYRQVDIATDVLSFPSDEIDPLSNRQYLGDIIISAEKASEQAKLSGRTFFDEVTMLIVHGCLHLSGMDHMEAEDKTTMKRFQEAILTELRVTDPIWPEDEK